MNVLLTFLQRRLFNDMSQVPQDSKVHVFGLLSFYDLRSFMSVCLRELR